MYVARRRDINTGIFQATSFKVDFARRIECADAANYAKGKPRGRSGLKAGTYFVAIEVPSPHCPFASSGGFVLKVVHEIHEHLHAHRKARAKPKRRRSARAAPNRGTHFPRSLVEYPVSSPAAPTFLTQSSPPTFLTLTPTFSPPSALPRVHLQSPPGATPESPSSSPTLMMKTLSLRGQPSRKKARGIYSDDDGASLSDGDWNEVNKIPFVFATANPPLMFVWNSFRGQRLHASIANGPKFGAAIASKQLKRTIMDRPWVCHL